MAYGESNSDVVDLGNPDAVVGHESVDDEPVVEAPDPGTELFYRELSAKILLFSEELCDVKLRPYQDGLALRMIESVLKGDADEITALWCRQSGKSETLSMVVAGLLVLLPSLAQIYPEQLGKFSKGFWLGLFAPTDNQADIIFDRVADKLQSKKAKAIIEGEMQESVTKKAKRLSLTNGSFVRRQTCNSRAKIEGSSYHMCVIDEAQEADTFMMNKSIAPMLASTAGTMVKIGTPSFTKGGFYESIQTNKRMEVSVRGAKRNHFEYNYQTVVKYNPDYRVWIDKEIARLGEDSDEFQMSYACKWMTDKGMLIGEEALSELADPTQAIVTSWYQTPCVAGIDVARVTDSTVVTVLYVDWDQPDEHGYYHHQILNWLEINNTDWETQYYQIADFLGNYNITKVGVEDNGMGSPVAERLERMLGHRCEVVHVKANLRDQGERWAHLIQLLQRKRLYYPGNPKATRTRIWRKFRQQMTDVEKVVKGNSIHIMAPEGRNSHDDFVDSLAIATSMTMDEMIPEVHQMNAPWFSR